MATTPDSQAEDRARNGALLLSAPVIAQPALVVASMLWARQESILLHPDNAAVNPPTVSRAIADPAIGDIFADLMLPAFVLLLFALWRIGAALYRPRHSRPMKALWTAFLLCEATAACGMVVLSQYTAFYSDDLHLLGSYMLFFGHGFGIALWGIFISFDRRSGEWDIPRPYSAHLQARLALAIAAASIVTACSISIGICSKAGTITCGASFSRCSSSP